MNLDYLICAAGGSVTLLTGLLSPYFYVKCQQEGVGWWLAGAGRGTQTTPTRPERPGWTRPGQARPGTNTSTYWGRTTGSQRNNSLALHWHWGSYVLAREIVDYDKDSNVVNCVVCCADNDMIQLST